MGYSVQLQFKLSWVQSVPAASPCYKATKQETCENAQEDVAATASHVPEH